MWVEAIISQEDFTALATELFPLSVHLGASDSDHYLLLSATTAVSLVEGRGLRFTCNAQIRWPVLGMDVPINIEALTVLVEPSVPDGAAAAAARPRLERCLGQSQSHRRGARDRRLLPRGGSEEKTRTRAIRSRTLAAG
jgi:hypothetical protein